MKTRVNLKYFVTDCRRISIKRSNLWNILDVIMNTCSSDNNKHILPSKKPFQSSFLASVIDDDNSSMNFKIVILFVNIIADYVMKNVFFIGLPKMPTFKYRNICRIS